MVKIQMAVRWRTGNSLNSPKIQLSKKAFSVAEALVTLLIGSLILGASAPMISKQIKHNNTSDIQAQILSREIDNLRNIIPQGVIVMWSGTTIPAGWALCDGTNGTPDLRNKFVIGAGDKYFAGNTGGTETVALNLEEIPSHNHELKGSTTLGGWDSTNGSECTGTGVCSGGKFTISLGDNPPWDEKYHQFSIGYTGGKSDKTTKAHENMPPYYALAYIMKK